MNRAWWRWVTGADEPPEQPREEFDAMADLKPAIRAALDDDDPAATLRAKWPWVPPSSRVAFLLGVRFAANDAAEEKLIETYERAIRAHHAARRPRWRRWRRRGPL